MSWKKHQEECKEKWLNENSHKSQVMGNNFFHMRPDFGFFVTVQKIDISEDIFKQEYDLISQAYFSVMKKMDEHYRKHNKNII